MASLKTKLKNRRNGVARKPAHGQQQSSRNFKMDEASRESSPSLMFCHPDWTMLRNLDTLGQKAGVTKGNIPKLVAKELVDNGCDAAGTCRVSLIHDGGLRIEDDGDGIPGSAEDLGRLFSVNRELVTSKMIRRTTRGALGNGLRVVSGAVLASGGRLRIATRGSEYELQVKDDGSATAKCIGKYKGKGTRIDIWLGEGPWTKGGFDEDSLEWARRTIWFSRGVKSTYKGRTSSYWYDSDSFFEVLQAAGKAKVREMVARFEGCSGAKAGKIADDFLGRACADLSRDDSETLLARMRENSRPVKATRLGHVGKLPSLPDAYASVSGTYEVKPSRGKLSASIPFIVEAWARPTGNSHVRVLINRTPATGEIGAYHEKTLLGILGCGLHHEVKVGRGQVKVWLNITCPYMSITTDGKAPDLSKMLPEISEAIRRATKKVRQEGQGAAAHSTEKTLILASLDAAIAQASGDQGHPFSLRQLYYVVRALIADKLGKELAYANFTKIVSDHESRHGEIRGLYRDARGVIYHPHLRREIPLGTLAVREYQRVPWTFNKVLFVEKEGFFAALKSSRWAERNDCALVTSKGYSTKALRTLIDLLGDGDELLQFFAIHDADAAGGMIFQSLQNETAAMEARTVEIINLGLEPWEAVKMGLPVEKAERKSGRKQPVAKYILDRKDGAHWKDWLQGHRIELNAMTTPIFLAWLDAKMAKYGNGRLVPPSEVMAERLTTDTKLRVEGAVSGALLAEHHFSQKVDAAMTKLGPEIGRKARALKRSVPETLAAPAQGHRSWADVVSDVAVELVKKVA
jgi:hypothetical protein